MKELKGEAFVSGRCVATIIDYGLVFFLTWLYIIRFGEPNDEGGYTASGFAALPPVFLWVIYFPAVESIFGATLGHYVMQLKVIKTSGDAIGFVDALKRHLLDPLEIFMWGIIAIIVIRKTPLHQRVGDLWADSIVVSLKKKTMDERPDL